MKSYLWLLHFFHICLCVCSVLWHEADDSVIDLDHSENGEAINGTLRNIVKKYHCSADVVHDEQTILYGTKAWTFPLQDVNLTLRYPTTNPENYHHREEFVITGVLVILYIDGPQSKGFITRGGILQDNISMTFVIQNITRLSYQFWLYGVKEAHINMSEYTWQQNLCS